MKWTDEEDAVLRRRYSDGATAVSRMLPGRTVKAVEQRAGRLGISRQQVKSDGIDPEVVRLCGQAFNAWRAPAPAQLSWRV